METAPDKARWLAAYRARAAALARLEAADLAAMTDAEAWRRIELLSTCAPLWRERPEWSGLVEQQAIFHRRSRQ